MEVVVEGFKWACVILHVWGEKACLFISSAKFVALGADV